MNVQVRTYDGLLAPYRIEQTRIGSVILTDIKVGLGAGNLVRLTRTGPARAEGRFDAGQAAFMELRHTPGFGGRIPCARLPQDTPVTQSTTMLDPRTPFANPVVWFLAALHIGPHHRLGYTGGDPRHGPEAVCLSIPDGSRCEITLAPGDDGSHTVRESGPVRLWAQVEHVHQVWDVADRPDWPRLGLAVTAESQTVFADESGNTIAILASDHIQLRLSEHTT